MQWLIKPHRGGKRYRAETPRKAAVNEVESVPDLAASVYLNIASYRSRLRTPSFSRRRGPKIEPDKNDSESITQDRILPDSLLPGAKYATSLYEYLFVGERI